MKVKVNFHRSSPDVELENPLSANTEPLSGRAESRQYTLKREPETSDYVINVREIGNRHSVSWGPKSYDL